MPVLLDEKRSRSFAIQAKSNVLYILRVSQFAGVTPSPSRTNPAHPMNILTLITI